MLTIQDLRLNAVEVLKEGLAEIWSTNPDTVNDLIHEVTDNIIPVYTIEILEIALSHLELATCKSELWPAYWEDTPTNNIISNIYEDVRNHLTNWFEERY